MREIKFRVWNTDRMIPPFTIQDAVLSTVHKPHLNLTTQKRHIYMQFTGLLDKNGKEIYEGDIISCQRVGNSLRDKKVVFFTDGMFTANESGDETKSSTPIIGIKCEIIGNIYENPELTK